MEYLNALRQLRKKYLEESTGNQVKTEEKKPLIQRPVQSMVEQEAPEDLFARSAAWLAQIRQASREAIESVPEHSTLAPIVSPRPRPNPKAKPLIDRRTQKPEASPRRVDPVTDQARYENSSPGYGDISEGEIEDMIRQEAAARGIGLREAILVFRGEGAGAYQSRVPREGGGSAGGFEASYGPYQLFTGGGLGNEYQEATGRDLVTDNTREGILNQVRFALDKAVDQGWKPWYGRLNVGVGEWDGLKGAKKLGNWK